MSACVACGGPPGEAPVATLHGNVGAVFCSKECLHSRPCGSLLLTSVQHIGPQGRSGDRQQAKKPAAAPPVQQRQAAAKAAKRMRSGADGESRSDDEESEEDTSSSSDQRPSQRSPLPPRLPRSRETTPQPAPVQPVGDVMAGGGDDNLVDLRPLATHPLYSDLYARGKTAFALRPRFVPRKPLASATGLSRLVGLESEKNIIRSTILDNLTLSTLAGELGFSGSNLLAYGPGGTGKSKLSESIAMELGYNVIAVSAADIISRWIGESAAAFRSLILSAQLEAAAASLKLPGAAAGIVVYLDEVDGLLEDPGSAETNTGVPSEFKLLVQPDKPTPNLVIVGATNFPDRIRDGAVLQRFDVKLFMGLPARNDYYQLVIFEIDSFYQHRPECYKAAAQALRRLTQIIDGDRTGRLRVFKACNGHSQREVRKMVRYALAGGKALGTVNFCKVRPPLDDDEILSEATSKQLWVATLDDNNKGGDKCTSAADLNHLLEVSRDDNTVCWPVPDAEKFLAGLENSPIKKAVTLDDLSRFLEFATEIISEPQEAERIQQTIDQFGIKPAK